MKAIEREGERERLTKSSPHENPIEMFISPRQEQNKSNFVRMCV